MKMNFFIDKGKLPFIDAQHVDYTILRQWNDSMTVELEIEVTPYNLSGLVYAGTQYGIAMATASVEKIITGTLPSVV